MKAHLIISTLLFAFASLASAQSAIKSSESLTRGWSQPTPKAGTHSKAIGVRRTTAPAVIVNNYNKLVAATRSSSRGIEVVPVAVAPVADNPQQVNVSVTVDSTSAQSFDNILFKLDSDEFYDDTSRLQVDAIAVAMKNVAAASFLVEGHTCDLGDDDHNKTLSDKRAARIVTELKMRGVNAERLLPLGFGETSPVVPNSSEASRQKNRRVTIYKRA